MATWPITCGTCERVVSADVVYGWPSVNAPQQQAVAAASTLWLRCPNCSAGSVKMRDGVINPPAPAGRTIQGLPDDVDRAWREARIAHNVAAYTASEMMCRKILMHLAVDVAGSQQGKRFVEYIGDLEGAGYIMTNLKPVVEVVKDRGNAANHELPASTENDSLRTLTITEHLLEGIYELPKLVAQPDDEGPSTP